MKIKLNTLDHQTEAIKAINYVFNDISIKHDNEVHQNPIFDVEQFRLTDNIRMIQEGNIPDIKKVNYEKLGRYDKNPFKEYQKNKKTLNIDVKMETGTGKTYCYTKLMYELHKNYNFNKFIILVPSVPIKEGTKKFIKSDYAVEHFRDSYKGVSLKLEILDAQKQKKGKKVFPQSINDFSRGTRLEKGKINCLLMTGNMLLSKKTMEKDYDQVLFGTHTVPTEVLRETKPIVIIDEPHKFKRDNKAYQYLIEKIEPQAVIRFGATFPKDEKTGIIDYENLVYNLNSIEAFNNNLVKGVAVQTLQNTDEDSQKIKLMSVITSKPKKAIFRNENTKKNIELTINESLSNISSEFHNLTIEEIGKTEGSNGKNAVLLSNGQVVMPSDILISSIYGDTYQELMIQQAINNHFKQEKENFFRKEKIKTISLFFIDSIQAYRGENNDGNIRISFENILKKKLKNEIDILKKDIEKTPNNQIILDYKEYLEVSLKDIKKTNGGYFSVDNSTKDEDIQEEINQILRDKEKILSFKDEKNDWNIMRFIFSKWTLREGWDNPNVFQITKLRSSGSEISKLQEVGRGLRLPVDEWGNRISDEEFYLTYLVDFSEKNFAESLTSEINSDISKIFNIKNIISKIASEKNMNQNDLFLELLMNKYIDMEGDINPEKAEEFFDKYPEFNQGLKQTKVIDETTKSRSTVNIRKEKFNELKELWEKINQKYYISLENLTDNEILNGIGQILEENIYKDYIIPVTQKKLQKSKEGIIIEEEIVDYYIVESQIPYNEFLKKVNSITSFPINLLHKGFLELNKKEKIRKEYFNKKTLEKFVEGYQNWLEKTFETRFSYKKMNETIGETSLTDISGNVKKDILQGNIGIYKDENIKVPEKFLYDKVVFDSTKEKENIVESNPLDEVVVFGKIPRRSIQVPLYYGGTTSPDFMYVLKNKDGSKSINLIIETKDIEKDRGLRKDENLKIESAKKFFKTLENEGIKVKFKKQLTKDSIIQLIHEITGNI